MDWDWNDFILFAGVFVGTSIGAFINYTRKPAKQDSILTGVGLELGSRHQIELLIQETAGCRVQLARIAEALMDKNTASVNDRLEELAQQIDRLSQEERNIQERQRTPPRRR